MTTKEKLENLVKKASLFCLVKEADILNVHCRNYDVIRVKQLLIWIMRMKMNLNVSLITKFFNRRDASSVFTILRKVNNNEGLKKEAEELWSSLINENKPYKDELNLLRAKNFKIWITRRAGMEPKDFYNLNQFAYNVYIIILYKYLELKQEQLKKFISTDKGYIKDKISKMDERTLKKAKIIYEEFNKYCEKAPLIKKIKKKIPNYKTNTIEIIEVDL